MSAGDVFEVIAREALSTPHVTRRVMFGRDTLLADGHPFAFLDGDRIALKLPAAGDLVASGEGVSPTMGRRVMRQWLAVPLVESAGLRERVDAARRFVDH